MSFSDTVSLLANIATAGGLLFTAVSYSIDKSRNRKQITMIAYQQLQETTFDKINTYKPSEIKAIVEDKTSDSYKELSSYLANIENFCLGINEGFYNFDIFYKLSNGYFDSETGILKPRLLPIIESKRSDPSKDYFRNIHIIWRKMDERSKKGNGAKRKQPD